MEKLNEITYKRGISKNYLKLRFKQLADYYEIELFEKLRNSCTYTEDGNTYTIGSYFLLNLHADKYYIIFKEKFIPAKMINVRVSKLIDMLNFMTRKINAAIEFVEADNRMTDVTELLKRYSVDNYDIFLK